MLTSLGCMNFFYILTKYIQNSIPFEVDYSIHCALITLFEPIHGSGSFCSHCYYIYQLEMWLNNACV